MAALLVGPALTIVALAPCLRPATSPTPTVRLAGADGIVGAMRSPAAGVAPPRAPRRAGGAPTTAAAAASAIAPPENSGSPAGFGTSPVASPGTPGGGPVAPPAGGGPAVGAVTVASGETADMVVAHWDPGTASGPAAVDLYDAATASPTSQPPLLSVPVAPGRDGVALGVLDPSRVLVAVVTTTGPGGARLASRSFRPTADGPVTIGAVGASSLAGPSAAQVGCRGGGYGAAVVTVDGYAGVQGSYCLPPTFSDGSGAFCVDHGLDRPAAAYGWTASPVGDGTPLVSQHGRAAPAGDLQRLAWIVGTWGSSTDPARAVAVGVVTHAVMGDYPGLGASDLSPPHLAVTGGDPAAIVADVAAMWAASAVSAGPYQLSLSIDPGPYQAGRPARGSLVLRGQGGTPVAGVPIDVSATRGASLVADGTAVTGPDGSLGFSFTPTSPDVALAASTGVALPGTGLSLWTPGRSSVAVQRVVTAGPGVRPSAVLHLAAAVVGTATLVKASSDPTTVAVGAGFAFDVAAVGADGVATTVAARATAADGSMAPVTGLAAGHYRVTETAWPPAFIHGGPWDLTLQPGEQATWTLTDVAAPRPLQVVKTGDDPDLAVGAGVAFALTPDPVPPAGPGSTQAAPGSAVGSPAPGSAVGTPGPGAGAGPVTTLTTGPDGTTAPVPVPPGRYLLTETSPPPGYQVAAPISVTVPPVGVAGPTLQVVSVVDHALPATLRMVKTDAATGVALAGARLRVERQGGDGSRTAVGVWSTVAAPTEVADLPPGRYVISEVAAPTGYQLSAPPQVVHLDPGRTLQVTVADAAIPVATTPAPPTAARPSLPAPLVLAPAPSSAVPFPATSLAFTGLPLWRLVLAGAGAATTGGVLVVLTRRRPRRDSRTPVPSR